MTRPRTSWWDGFDASLGTHRNALADLNEGALVRGRTFTGIGRGPADYQDRIRLALVAEVDPAGRITLPKQKRGGGW